jgi:2-aminoethylphosphonate-pyruvate transaminase
VESGLGSVIAGDGRLLVVSNGAYGERLAAIAARLAIAHEVLRFPEEAPIGSKAVTAALDRGSPMSPSYTARPPRAC